MDSMDWKHYVAHRPGYPDSIWKLWTNYHQGPLEKVHDIGAGSGNGAEGLLNCCAKAPPTHVVLSDVKTECGQEQRIRFEGRFPNTTFFYRTARGEDAWDAPLGLEQLDFVMCCESLHWTVLESTLSQVGKSLRKDGTFAAVIYAPFPIIRNNKTADRAFRKFVASHVEGLLSQNWMNEGWKRAARQLSHGIDCVSLPEDTWKDVKRVHINVRDGGWGALEDQPVQLQNEFAKESLPDLGAYERVTIDDDEDWQKLSTSLDWLQEMLKSLRFGFGEASFTSPEWLHLQDCVGEGGQLDLEWQVQMILARARM